MAKTSKPKKLPNYAFIDGQNLNLGIGRDIVNSNGKVLYKGQKLDYKKLRGYLHDKYNVKTAYIFLGMVPSYSSLYESLQKAGYILIFKSVAQYIDKDGKVVVKGNVDTDIVLYSVGEVYKEYDKAVFISGDGDFLSLYQHMDKRDKLEAVLVPNRYAYSKLLNEVRSHVHFLTDVKPVFRVSKNKKSLPIKKTRSGGRL